MNLEIVPRYKYFAETKFKNKIYSPLVQLLVLCDKFTFSYKYVTIVSNDG